MRAFIETLQRRPVIAAARDIQGVRLAARSAAEVIFLLGGSILTLGEMVETARDGGRLVMIHMDLLEGLGHDLAAVEWCAKSARPDGLISTRAPLLKRASECGMITIQRLFIMDSSSLTHGIKLLKASKPDMVEVLPGVIPKVITTLNEALNSVIIAGGMITTIGEVTGALNAGALAVSSSEPALWDLSRSQISPEKGLAR